MGRNLKLQIITLSSIAVLILGFQNCSKVGFSSEADELGSALGENIERPIVSEPAPEPVTSDLSIDYLSEENSLIEIEGRCTSANGAVALANDIIGDGRVTNCVDNKYKMCARLQHTGSNLLKLAQANLISESGDLEIDKPAFTTTVTVEDRVFNFSDIAVLSTTKANISVKCFPGSSISAEIYGVSQIKSPLVCPSNGQVSFDVKLVAKLRNTGQRVVNVRQLMENGFITDIFADVDNVSSAHSCSIDKGIANRNMCEDTAGEVSGTCKPGLPVMIYVNGVAQHSEVCNSNGKYTLDNILLESGSNNEVKIEQYNSFTSTSCTSSKTVSRIEDL